MNWFKVFSQEKSNGSQPPPGEKQQDFTGVLYVVIEETIMAGAQWLIVFTRRMLDGKRMPSQQPAEVSPNQAEELIAKATTMVEQFHDRASSLLALEQRLHSVEQFLSESSQPGSDENSAKVEALLQEIQCLTQQLQQANQQVAILEHRIINLEKLLAKYSMIPKFVEQHHRAIAALQAQMAALETPLQNNHKLVLNHRDN